ncbi:hypothetical protein FSP39_015861 [Pinctada imbricata]|uniref:Large ribosomal subunit protein mL45 n=1 Tax=Pinctada imbricata TaxID=66713 RepID=A0AA88YSP3_PINIB|nr:hypothetical protein FSP39_015861 [Pinctada imbricata]
MTHGMEKKTLRWKFVESVEPPRLVQARTMEAILKKNYYAQVTVRFHTKQIMALYDQFGRLMYGSNSIVKNILEYIVFEKHISNVYGNWRIHSKIVPDWMPEGDPIVKTFILDRPEKPPEKEEEEVLSQEAKEDENEAKGKDQPIAA